MKLSFTILALALLSSGAVLAQSDTVFHSMNVAVLAEDNFGWGGSGDVWGFEKSGKHYALSTIEGGLHIAIVLGTSPKYYDEVAYVNHDNYLNPQTLEISFSPTWRPSLSTERCMRCVE